MYTIAARIAGTTPLLQHAYPMTVMETQMVGATRVSGSRDYSLEWMDTMYTTSDGYLCQPASHIEGAMVRAASAGTMGGCPR